MSGHVTRGMDVELFKRKAEREPPTAASLEVCQRNKGAFKKNSPKDLDDRKKRGEGRSRSPA